MDPIKLKRQNFSVSECNRFDLLVKKYFHIINDKRTDGPSSRRREATWETITAEFNSQGFEHRTNKQLRARFDNLKRRSRPRPLISDPLECSPKIYSSATPMAPTNKIDDDCTEKITIIEKRQNFTVSEGNRLDLLVKKYFHILKDKRTNGRSSKLRETAWNTITAEFNSQGFEHRTRKQLRARFDNVKRQSRSKPLISDPLECSSNINYSATPMAPTNKIEDVYTDEITVLEFDKRQKDNNTPLPMAPTNKIEDVYTDEITVMEFDERQKDNNTPIPMAPTNKIEDVYTDEISVMEFDERQKDNSIDEKEKQDSLETEILMKQRDEIDVRMRQQLELHELAIKNERLSVTKKLLEIKKLRLEIKLLEEE